MRFSVILVTVPLVALSLAGCRLFDGGEYERAVETARRAQDMAIAGKEEELSDLIRRVEEDLKSTVPGPGAAALLHSTLGWYYSRNPEEAARESLETAADHYRAALAIDSDNRATEKNLALVWSRIGKAPEARELLRRRIRKSEDPAAIYDLWLTSAQVSINAKEWDAAIDALASAFEQHPEDPLAQLWLVELAGQHEDAVTVNELHRLCVTFAARGSPTAALRGLEVLVERGGRPGGLEDWVQIASRQDELAKPGMLERLSPPDDAEKMAMIELQELVEDPRGAVLEYWIAPQDISRRHVIAQALQSIARAARERDLEEVAAIYDRAIEVAPTTEWYKDHPEFRPDARLDAAIDRAMLYHQSGKYDQEFVDWFDDSLTDGELSKDKFRAFDRGDAVALKYFGLVGLVVASLQDESDESTGPNRTRRRETAIDFLEEAISHAQAGGGAAPQLHEKLAELYEETNRPVLALKSLADAAVAHVESGARKPAFKILSVADEVADTTTDGVDREITRIEDLLYPRYGFYLGGSFGITDILSSKHDLREDLKAAGNMGVDVDMDDNDYGFKIFAGYRFDAPVALELGFVSLGGPDTDVRITTASRPGLKDELKDALPNGGHGISFGVVAYPFEKSRFATTIKVGGWAWVSNMEIKVKEPGSSSETVDVKDDPDIDQIDFFFGAGVEYRLTRRIFARAEWERYFFETFDDVDSGVDLWSLGVFYKF